jgi:phage terminase small subunit
MRKLTNKERAFIEHYLQCWNASDAARRAGYSSKTAGSIGHENLKKPEISSEIKRRLEELQAGADEVVTRLTSHARGSMKDFVVVNDDGTATIDLVKAQSLNQLHLIKKLKVTRRQLKDGESEAVTEFELYDAQGALVTLGRAHGLFVDKSEITGKNGGPIEIGDDQLTDEQRAARIAALFDAARTRRAGPASGDGQTPVEAAAGSADDGVSQPGG